MLQAHFTVVVTPWGEASAARERDFSGKKWRTPSQTRLEAGGWVGVIRRAEGCCVKSTMESHSLGPRDCDEEEAGPRELRWALGSQLGTG